MGPPQGSCRPPGGARLEHSSSPAAGTPEAGVVRVSKQCLRKSNGHFCTLNPLKSLRHSQNDAHRPGTGRRIPAAISAGLAGSPVPRLLRKGALRFPCDCRCRRRPRGPPWQGGSVGKTSRHCESVSSMPHPGNAYSAETGANEWRVIVPRRGKLTPFVSPQRFRSERDARQWMQSDEGEALVRAQSGGAPAGDRRAGLRSSPELPLQRLESTDSAPWAGAGAGLLTSAASEVRESRARGLNLVSSP